MATTMMSNAKDQAVIDLLAGSLARNNQWPLDLAKAAAESFARCLHSCPEEFDRYEKFTVEQQKDLWYYFATGWNHGRLFETLKTN